MIVARAEVDVAFQPATLAAHDQRHLAVRLVADDAVDDVRAGFLQLLASAMFAASSKRARSSITR